MRSATRPFLLPLVLALALTACEADDDSPADDEAPAAEEEAGDAEAAEIEPQTWQLGFNTTEGSVRDIAANEFADILDERTDGAITVEIYPDELLGSEQEMLESLAAGAIDLQLAGMGAMSPMIPEYSTLALPFMVDDFDEAYAVLDGPIGEEWMELAEEHNYKVLAHADLGFAQITNNVRPIEDAADMEGLVIRSPDEPTSIATFERLGASVSTMPFTEVYLGLQQGVVDGQFNPLDAIYETQFHEVQEYLAMVNIFYYHVNFAMNLDLFEGLQPELQEIVLDAAEEAAVLSRQVTQENEVEMQEVLQDHFEEITDPDPDSFRERVEPAFDDEFADVIPPETIEETRAFIEDLSE